MLLYVHSEFTDNINLLEAANIFIENKDSCKKGLWDFFWQRQDK